MEGLGFELKQGARLSTLTALQKKGSKKRHVTKKKIANYHQKMSNIRKDWLSDNSREAKMLIFPAITDILKHPKIIFERNVCNYSLRHCEV